MAFTSPKSRQIIVISLISSIILNFYLFMFSVSPQGDVFYDSPDHHNAAQDISYKSCRFQEKALVMKEIEWDKINHIHSSCLCGADQYCRCGPSPATDIVAFTYDLKNIILVNRADEPLGLATVGGFVELGEQIEDAAKREFKEETNLEVYDNKLFQVFTYSYPHQDPRRPAMSTVFVAQIRLDEEDMKEAMIAGSDAKELIIFPLKEAANVLNSKYDGKFGFEIHRKFIRDALYKAQELKWIDLDSIHKLIEQESMKEK